MTGTLYLVATPIGNLGDISIRGIEVLRSVDYIAVEDSRQTIKLLNHLGIVKQMLSYHKFNERMRIEQILASLEEGKNLALVSDAGTPGLSDPGSRLVRTVLAKGIKIVPIPGASAMATIGSLSGYEGVPLLFHGFIPEKKQRDRDFLNKLRGLSATHIVFEAPHRIVETLAWVVDQFNDPPTVLGRELTKINEEIIAGTASSVLEKLSVKPSIKGECSFCFHYKSVAAVMEKDEEKIRKLATLLKKTGVIPPKVRAKIVAGYFDLDLKQIYRRLSSDGGSDE